MRPKWIALSLLFGLCVLLSGTKSALADDEYIVQLGDSLDAIAVDTGCGIDSLQTWENQGNENLVETLPVLLKTADSDVTMTRITYTVQQGDTLEKISERFHISPADIISDNELLSEFLEIGEVITIGIPTSLAPAYVPSEVEYVPTTSVPLDIIDTANSTNIEIVPEDPPLDVLLEQPIAVEDDLVATDVMPSNGFYTVKEGDTLTSVASRYGMDEAVLKELNYIQDDVIYEGQNLRLSANAELSDNDFDLDFEFENEIDLIQNTYNFGSVDNVDWEQIDPSTKAGTLIYYAKDYIGCPYVYGGTSPAGFDCSGFVQYCFRNALGINLKRTAADQATEGYEVFWEDLIPGDIIYFSSGGYINHVGIYVGGGNLLHASTPSTGVIVSEMNASYYQNNYAGARRIIEE